MIAMLSRGLNKALKALSVRALSVRAAFAGLVVLQGLVLSGCMTAEGAAQLGRSEHPKVMASYGGAYDNPALAAYVTRVGQKVAAGTQPGAGAFQFMVLDSPVVNAFALPGGYAYVTRGLLALINDEAELAAVLGHEMTHVTKEHTAQRYNRSQAAGIGTLLVAMATGSKEAVDMFGMSSQLFLLNYSRDQEFESDKVGTRLVSKAGYDPYAMGDFLKAMGAQTTFNAARVHGQKAQRSVDYFSTHPNTAERVSRAHGFARNLVGAQGQGTRSANGYLNTINGMTYGDSPEQGFVRGRVFSHKGLKFRFEVPQGFVLQNQPDAVVAVGPGGAMIRFDRAGDYRPGTPLASYLGDVWVQSLKVRIGSIQRKTINGIDTASAVARVNTKDGPVDLRLVVLADRSDGVSRFMVIAPVQVASTIAPGVDTMVKSFRRLSDAQAARLKPLRVRVVTVKSGDTVSGHARSMAFDDFREERLRIINALSSSEGLRTGQRLKIIAQ